MIQECKKFPTDRPLNVDSEINSARTAEEHFNENFSTFFPKKRLRKTTCMLVTIYR